MKIRRLRMLFLVATMIGSMQLFSCSKDNGTPVNPLAGSDGISVLTKKTEANASANLAGNENGMGGCISTLPAEELSEAEIEALTTMREEELLAHDVYVQLYTKFKMPIFNNISKSETQHTLAIKSLLVKYNLTDPALNHVSGVFVNADLQALYTSLVAQGTVSLNAALTVGCTIEDLDIYDLHNHIANDVDNQDILFVFGNLEKGSRNHMRSFYTLLKKRGITYVPQFISVEYFNQIVTTPHEIGSGPCPI
jgi:hypothetical protein